eukprot:9437720-Pyramimonas_sp.AAC.1
MTRVPTLVVPAWNVSSARASTMPWYVSARKSAWWLRIHHSLWDSARLHASQTHIWNKRPAECGNPTFVAGQGPGVSASSPGS